MINTKDFKTKTYLKKANNVGANKAWVVAMDVVYSAVKIMSKADIYSFPSFAARRKEDTVVRDHLFCHPKVSVFCQGWALYFVKVRVDRVVKNKLPPLPEMSVSDIREQMLPAKSHESLGSLPSVALSSIVGKSPLIRKDHSTRN